LKACPKCGKEFNWLQRAVGEYRRHLRDCPEPEVGEEELSLAARCRGCPAGCFEDFDYSKYN